MHGFSKTEVPLIPGPPPRFQVNNDLSVPIFQLIYTNTRSYDLFFVV